MKRLTFLLLLGPLFPAPAAAFTPVTSPNAYMVENTSGTSPSGQVCYDFQTRPGCSAFIAGISTGSIPAGSTQYIQNSANPTTATQVFNVSSGTIGTLTISSAIVQNSTTGVSGQFLQSNGPGVAPTWATQASANALLSSTNTWTAQQTFNAAIIPSSGIAGVTNGSNASTGMVGEFVSSVVGTTNSPATGQYGDLTSITLSAGDWDITGAVEANTNTAAAVTEMDIGISSTTGNSSAGLIDGSTQAILQGTVCTSNLLSFTIPLVRISQSASTVWYLKFRSVFSGSIPQYNGSIKARRRR